MAKARAGRSRGGVAGELPRHDQQHGTITTGDIPAPELSTA
ncbi:hypothetical protein [Streptomyces pakalii]|uniref:Transposase n=1 Tax=Streptomyces pakalii TaxID=3036494 RepID=A0ABT7DHY1_9ACTN|nr:hypothetical protein [Streptomyces pakalii]MDJ1645412.1 hypothetical protein [Streptomyces pakalii]